MPRSRGVQDVTARDEVRGCRMAQAVQRHIGVAGLVGERAEPVTQAAGRQPDLVGCRCGEQPRPEPFTVVTPLPAPDELPPQLGCFVPERHPADPAAFGASQDLIGRTSRNSQNVAVQIPELQGRQLGAAGTGIGGQMPEQQHLLGPVSHVWDMPTPPPPCASTATPCR